MFKKIAFAGLGIALLASPLIASAQTTDVSSVVAALLAQIKTLQTQIAQMQGQSSQTTNCVNLSGNLTLGSSGSDVTNLQNYLIAKGYLDAQYSTGYYGFLTATAVGKMQVSLGILSSANDSAYGITGPQTRAAIVCGNQPVPQPQPGPVPPIACTMQYLMCSAGTHHVDGPGACQQQCVPDSTSSGAPVVTGVSGPASLSVGQQGTWTVHASVPSNPGAQLSYSVIWGDEPTSAQIQAYATSAAVINTSSSFTHAYQTAGVYNPTFTVSNSAGSAQTSASVQVGGTTPPCTSYYQVTAPSTDPCAYYVPPVSSTNFSASPTSGQAPLMVEFESFGTMAGTIVFGDGSSGSTMQAPGGPCDVPNPPANCGSLPHTFGAFHTYTSAGTYTATLTQGPACPATMSSSDCPPSRFIGAVTITVAPAQMSCTLIDCVAGYQPSGPYCSANQTCVPNTTPTPVPVSCPMYSLAQCVDGTYVSQGSDANGCQLAPKCVPNTPSSNAAQQIISSALSIENQYLTIENQMSAQSCGDPTTVSNNIALSQRSIQFLTQAQTNAAMNSSPTVQATAMQQLDQIVASGQLHTANDVSAAQQQLNSCSVSTGNSCKVLNIYAQNVPGYVYSNLFMQVQGLNVNPSDSVAITGADSYNYVTFSLATSTGSTVGQVLQASQTFGYVDYILARMGVIVPVSVNGNPVSCQPMGGGSTATSTTATSGSANPNLANALTALQSVLKALMAKIGQ